MGYYVKPVVNLKAPLNYQITGLSLAQPADKIKLYVALTLYFYHFITLSLTNYISWGTCNLQLIQVLHKAQRHTINIIVISILKPYVNNNVML